MFEGRASGEPKCATCVFFGAERKNPHAVTSDLHDAWDDGWEAAHSVRLRTERDAALAALEEVANHAAEVWRAVSGSSEPRKETT